MRQIYLDPEKFSSDAESYKFVATLHEKIEELRSETASKNQHFKLNRMESDLVASKIANALTNAFEDQVRNGTDKDWYQLATDIVVLKTVGHKLGISIADLAKRINDVLDPPNWETFFWIAQWDQELRMAKLVALEYGKRVAVAADMQLESKLEEEQKRTRENFARSGGIKRRELSNKAKKWVREKWLEEKASYDENKSEFARVYSNLVKREFAVQISEKRIREFWLSDTH
jgi:hypothetical protein